MFGSLLGVIMIFWMSRYLNILCIISQRLYLGMWRSSNSNSTTFSTDSKFVECIKRVVLECKFVENSLFYDWFLMHTRSRLLPESADKLLSKIQLPIATKLQLFNVQCNFCSVMCYIVLIWILSHPFNWHEPVCCILSDKINLYQATFAFEFDEFWKLKFAFKIRIQRMQILNSFVTSLVRSSEPRHLSEAGVYSRSGVYWNTGLKPPASVTCYTVYMSVNINSFCHHQLMPVARSN